MKTLKERLMEMKYASPFGTEKDRIKNLLIAASGNDQRVLNDIVDCLSEDQLVKCFDKLSKVYGYTGSYGQTVRPKI